MRLVGTSGGSREGSRKRKRRVHSDEQNPRSRPRPRLQATYGVSDLQKINRAPATSRKSIQQTCHLYDLDLNQLMNEVGRSAYLTNLPVFVDEYTEIDTWDAIRTHLPSTAYRSGAKMQRIRAKRATGDTAAKNDPVLYVDPGQGDARTAKFHGTYLGLPNLYQFTKFFFILTVDCSVGQVKLIFRLTPTTLVPNPPLMAFVRAFSKIPSSANKTTGLLTIKQLDAQRRYRILLASDIVRLCPLAPVIHGKALRDVDCDNMLDRYSEFYLNKYRNIDDYMFMYSDAL